MNEGIKLDSQDIEANEVADQIGIDAELINSVTTSLIQSINELIDTHPGIFSRDMTLGDFDLVLEVKENNHNLVRIKRQLEHFLTLFPNSIKFSDSLEEFMKVLEAKRIESDQILHPKNYKQ